MNDTIVTWSSSYSVGVKTIDDQHKKLIKLTNKLFASCMAGNERVRLFKYSSNSIFLKVIHEAVDYVSYHFGAEEKIMEKVNYPEYMMHKQEHSSFVHEILGKVDEFKAGKNNAPLSFVHYLKDWVLQHIAVSDKKLGTYLLEMHKNGTLLQILKTKVGDADHIQID